MTSKTWYRIRSAAETGDDPEILIYDYIGDFGVTARQFNDDLMKLKGAKAVTIRINSPGGDVFQGNAIIDMLQRFQGRYKTVFTVYVDGLAASMASAIAMIGDRVIMPRNSLIMIHDPAAFILGGSKELRKYAEVLDKLKTSMVSLYASKSGKDEEEISAIMSEETWYDADEAVEAGFADEVEEPVAIAATFDLSRFTHPPAAYGGDPVDGDVDATMEGQDMTTKPETAAEMEARIRAEVLASLPPQQQQVPVTPAAETADQIRARITKENADIAAACVLAGFPEMTTALLGKSMSEVLAALEAKKVETASTTTQTPHARVGADGKTLTEGQDDNPKPEVPDTNAIYAKFNRRAA